MCGSAAGADRRVFLETRRMRRAESGRRSRRKRSSWKPPKKKLLLLLLLLLGPISSTAERPAAASRSASVDRVESSVRPHSVRVGACRFRRNVAAQGNPLVRQRRRVRPFFFGITGFLPSFRKRYRLFPGVGRFPRASYRVLPSFFGFFFALLGFCLTVLSIVLPGPTWITGFYLVLGTVTGFFLGRIEFSE